MFELVTADLKKKKKRAILLLLSSVLVTTNLEALLSPI